MTEPAPAGSPTTAAATASSLLPPASPVSPAAPLASPTSQALVPAPSTTDAALAGTSASSGTTAKNGVADPMTSNGAAMNSGYGGYGSAYGGYGMDPYMGGMGMMGLGGMGMMGLGGMGMMGMGMYGMTPEAQRSQMMMFMISRMVELWGMFSNVVQMTLGSAIQFAGNYVGINQRLGQVEEEGMAQEERYLRVMQEHRQALLELPESERCFSRDRERLKPRKTKSRQRPSFLRTLVLSLLRHVIIVAVAYFATKRIVSWYHARQKAKEIAAAAVQNAVSQ